MFIKNASYGISKLVTLRSLLPQYLLLKLHYALKKSYLSYCLPTRGVTCNNHGGCYLRLQKKTLRTITFNGFNFHSSVLFIDLKVVSIFQLQLTVENSSFAEKVTGNSFLVQVTITASQRDRSVFFLNMLLPQAHTSYGEQTLDFNGAQMLK